MVAMTAMGEMIRIQEIFSQKLQKRIENFAEMIIDG
jgi:hypothetical protein